MSEEEGSRGGNRKVVVLLCVQQEVGESPRAGAWREHDVKEIAKD